MFSVNHMLLAACSQAPQPFRKPSNSLGPGWIAMIPRQSTERSALTPAARNEQRGRGHDFAKALVVWFFAISMQ